MMRQPCGVRTQTSVNQPRRDTVTVPPVSTYCPVASTYSALIAETAKLSSANRGRALGFAKNGANVRRACTRPRSPPPGRNTAESAQTATCPARSPRFHASTDESSAARTSEPASARLLLDAALSSRVQPASAMIAVILTA